MEVYIALLIFFVAFTAIIFEAFDKSLTALAGALLMITFGILTPEQAVAAIKYETILLLLGMMIVVNIASKSGVLQWINVKIISLTRGNPLLIFVSFCLLTGVISAFLDNVTTILIIIPITIELLEGMGKDPRIYVFSEIIFANIGGGLTLIGDPTNIIIGGSADLSFMDFITNLWIPILLAALSVISLLAIFFWKQLKPISHNFIELFTVNFLIRKIKRKFAAVTLHRDFIIKVLGIMSLTFIGFILHGAFHIPSYLIAFSAAIILAILTSKRVSIHESFRSVEWTTLFFFAGLFIMVKGVEQTGALELLSHWITNSTSNLLYLSLIVLWASGFVSSLIDNVPFVTIMVPVILSMQAELGFPQEAQVLWWALSLGAILGGNATMIGASANVVGIDLLKKHGYRIKFLDHLKIAMPLSLVMLAMASIYLIFRIGI